MQQIKDIDLAKRSETAIYAIGLRSTDQATSSSRGFKEAEFVLRQLSQETGGRAFFPTTAAELPKIYTQISEELASQYSMAYASRNPLRNGAWRRIQVRVQTTYTFYNEREQQPSRQVTNQVFDLTQQRGVWVIGR